MILNIKRISLLIFFYSLIIFGSETRAQIVYKDISDTVLTYPVPTLETKTKDYYFDLNEDGINDIRFRMWSAIESGGRSTAVRSYAGLRDVGKTKYLVELVRSWPHCAMPLVSGDSIDSHTSTWHSDGLIYVAAVGGGAIRCNTPFDDRYYGFRFYIGDSVHYGWLNLDVVDYGPITLKSYAYNTTPGQFIYAGDTIPPAVGINEKNTEVHSVKLFPIPVSDHLTIDLKSFSTPAKVIVYNIRGQTIKEFETSSNPFKTNLSDLEQGIYFLTISNNDGAFIHRKIIKD